MEELLERLLSEDGRYIMEEILQYHRGFVKNLIKTARKGERKILYVKIEKGLTDDPLVGMTFVGYSPKLYQERVKGSIPVLINPTTEDWKRTMKSEPIYFLVTGESVIVVAPTYKLRTKYTLFERLSELIENIAGRIPKRR